MYALEEYRSVQSKGENNLRPILYSGGSMPPLLFMKGA